MTDPGRTAQAILDIQAATDQFLFEIAAGNRMDAERQLRFGADINAVDPLTGLSPLHFAIGRNRIELVEWLLENGALVRPDRQGRWPSTIAELCEVDEVLLDLVVEAELKLDSV